jgi:uncharacterized protein (DUF58 family)
MKILYAAFWTFILNILCSYGYSQLAWFLLLLPFILFFIFVFMIGIVLNKRTTSVPSINASSSSPFYQQQVDAQSMLRNQGRDRKRIRVPGSEQNKWFEPPNRWFPEKSSDSSDGGGGGYYPSYSGYGRALDQKMKQMYDETHENVKKK